jgi:putative selenate reductase
MLTIEARGLYYKALNRQIRKSLSRGEKAIVLKDVLGQRYIGGGLESRAHFDIYGTPGQDLGAFMNGPKIIVHGNAQDGVGNTMNDGRIIVHGKAGEIPGHSMRGGKVFVRGDVEYRAAIHMKEYLDRIPWLIIGGTAKDYCGEYMAGGRVVVLNLENKKGLSVGYSVGTGIHGGAIFVRGEIEEYQLGTGAIVAEIDASDETFLKEVFEEYSRHFGTDLSGIVPGEFVKVTKKGHRPFAKLYTPGMNVKTDMPVHFNLTPPCANACPTGIPTPVFLNLIKDGKIAEAQRLMDEYTPFRMSVCGTACPAPCVDACSRGMIDEPLRLQEMAKEYYPNFNPDLLEEEKEQVISIIGAGPAGLSAAWQLARRGYKIRVYDALDNLGGKVRAAIPRERLSDRTLGRDIERITSLPIEFNTGTRVDREMFDKICSDCDAVLIATGAHTARRIEYPGAERILSGLQFLMDINVGNDMHLSGREVVIIGAGNVGMDIACESWRLGAKKVTALDVQKPLAFGHELDSAMELGTDILWPKFIEKLEREKVFFTDGTELRADVVLFSIGEMPDTSFLPESVLIDERGYIFTAEKSFRSSDLKIYGCGDIRRPGLISDAVGSGRLAALEINAFLTGREFIYPEKNLVPKRRINTLYFGGEEDEIDRCISCGTCIFCDTCIENCPQEAITRNGEIFTIDPLKCILCYTCANVCPRGAIQAEFFIDLKDAAFNE